MKKYYLIILTGLLAACTKTSDLTPASNAQLIKIEQDANNSSSYTYNSDGTLASYHVVHNQAASTVNITYDANKKPISAIQDNELFKISYANGQISKIENYDQSNSLEGYFTYQYTGNKATETDYYYQNALVMKALNTYNTTGDLISQKTYYIINGVTQLASTVTYEYDTKPNPMANGFNLLTMLLGSQPAHNITKQTQYDNAGNLTQTDSYTITYNSNNYPSLIQIKTTKPGLADVIATQKYTYQ